MSYLSRRRKKRRLTVVLAILGVLLLAGAAVFFAFSQKLPFGSGKAVSEPEATPKTTPEPAATSEPAPSPSPFKEPAKSRDRSLYEIAVKLSEDGTTLSCIERLTYVNNSDDTLYQILLNTYPNAFVTAGAVANDEFRSVYGDTFSQGSLHIKRVSLNGIPSYYEYANREKTQLRVPLVLELGPGESAELLLEFDVLIPKANYRFGIGRHATMLGNVFPIAAVYENGWRYGSYCPVGDPFYSDVSDYRLAVQLPKEFALACTGSVVSVIESGDTVTHFIAAPGVRDAALAFSDKYTSVSKESSGVSILSYAGTGARAAFAAEAADEAIKVFSKIIGPYPYDSLSVIQSDIGGGMEYPELIMIGEVCYGKYNKEFGEFCIAHEVAHQWWYASVGSDQITAPWLDEALTEYMGFVYWREKYGIEAYEEIWNRYLGPSAGSPVHPPIDTPVTGFSGLSDYAYSVYYEGARMFRALNERLGDEVFYDALKRYYRENAGQNASERDLVNAFSEASGEDLTGFFTEWGIRIS